MKKIILITIGDINGIGIEILLKIWKTHKNNRFILLTNINLIKKYLIIKKHNIKLNKINNQLKSNIKLDFNKFLHIFNFESVTNEKNAYNSLLQSYKLLKTYSYFSGVVNLPINKYNIIKKIDKKFVGQTEFYMDQCKSKVANMVFVYKKIIFTTLTTHISLKHVNKKLLKKNFILNKIISLNKSLINDFKITKPKIIISGINPHSGENNTIGDEENVYIKPILKKLIKKNVLIEGPYSADGIINKRNLKKFDCFIFNYHDQALIPFKIISKNNGLNFTSGIDIIRVSPDHGTGYDIVGKNIAKMTGLINCFKFVNKIYNNNL